jgi:hypothetical protein
MESMESNHRHCYCSHRHRLLRRLPTIEPPTEEERETQCLPIKLPHLDPLKSPPNKRCLHPSCRLI